MLPQLPSRCLTSQEAVYDSLSTAGSTEPVSQLIEPRPIYQLNADCWVLFAELVQSTQQPGGREMVWVRPLLLVNLREKDAPASDLSHAADLLWPAAHFSPTYAEDMLPHLVDVRLLTLEDARQQLQDFVRLAWDSHNNDAATDVAVTRSQ